MKNSAIMKTAVVTLAICAARSGPQKCPNMSTDQSAIGKLSRMDRPMVRASICCGRSTRASVAIYLSPEQHGQSQIAVIERDQHHRHPCDRGHAFVARYAPEAHKRHKPDRSSNKEHRKEKKRRRHTPQPS